MDLLRIPTIRAGVLFPLNLICMLFWLVVGADDNEMRLIFELLVIEDPVGTLAVIL